jgi:hypothetical protein
MGMVPPAARGQSFASSAPNSSQTSGAEVLIGCPLWSGSWMTR